MDIAQFVADVAADMAAGRLVPHVQGAGVQWPNALPSGRWLLDMLWLDAQDHPERERITLAPDPWDALGLARPRKGGRP